MTARLGNAGYGVEAPDRPGLWLSDGCDSAAEALAIARRRWVPVGSRVKLLHDEVRYPHFIAPAGALGVVVDVGDPTIELAVRLDEHLEGAEDWSNEVHWFYMEEDWSPLDDVELVVDESRSSIYGGIE
jgi:hypothetical protein